MPRRPSHVAWKILAVLLVGIACTVVLRWVPADILKKYGDLFHGAIVLLVGSSIAILVEQWLKSLDAGAFGGRAISMRFLARLVLFLAIGLALLAAFGVGISSVVFGSAFLTVILGLAGQNFFSNLIAGIGLVIFRPFQVGDFISFVSDQYSVLVPSFPHEKMKPAYYGTVRDINLMYTILDTDDNVPMVVPNGVLITASIENHRNQQEVPYRFRFDLDLTLDPHTLMSRLTPSLRALPYPAVVTLTDVGPSTLSIAISGSTRGQRDHQIRHDILLLLIPLIQEMKGITASPSADNH